MADKQGYIIFDKRASQERVAFWTLKCYLIK